MNLFSIICICCVLYCVRYEAFAQASDIKPIDTLTLEEVLAIVNANHPKLNEIRLGRNRAEAQIMRAWAGLDPQLSAEIGGKNKNDAFTSQTSSATMEIPVYWGPKFIAGWRRNLGLFDEDMNTQVSGEVSFGIMLPLWRNIMIDKNRASIQKAEQNPTIAEAEILEIRNELFLKASEKYWDWSGSRAKLSIAKNLLSIAEFRLQGIIAELNSGERARIDSIEMSQEIQRRRGAFIKARREYEKAGIALSVFLWNNDGTPSTIPQGIAPMNPMEVFPLDTMTYRRDKELALQKRPELIINSVEQNQAEVDTRFAREQQKPDISLKLLPYSTVQTIDGSIPDYKVGIQAEMPLLFRDARGQTSLAEIKQQSLSFKRNALQREISASVDDAASELIATYEQTLAAKAELSAAEQMENAERELYQRGEATLFTVNFRERFTVESASREIDARMNFRKAIAYYIWSIAGF
ncbi:MAG: TolC family protein [Candidatus Kapaibacteriota bacterium]